MSDQPVDVVVAGHICVDVIPTFEGPETPIHQLLVPGRLTKTGPALAATGGAVSNAGLALHRLGVQVELMGKVGGDLFGQAVIDILNRRDPRLTRGMIRSPDEPSSYTIVINPPGVDRIFLHAPGPNDTYAAADLDLETVAKARIFHFGYPPIMRRMYEHDGAELVALLSSVRATGATVSLDLSLPDPNSEAGRADWQMILSQALPYVDLFAPSLDEIVFMLERARFDDLVHGGLQSIDLVRSVAERLLQMGPALVLLKLGDRGLYLRSADSLERLQQTGRAALPSPERWVGRELYSPCFQVWVGGTTGAGDCTIAGFLASMLRGLGPEMAVTMALAVGACSVESPDATSGVPPWPVVESRVAAGWSHHPVGIDLPDWHRLDGGLWAGPADRRAVP